MARKIYLYDNDYDCIGSGTLAAEYISYQLKEAAGDDVEIHISSVGGDAFQAVAIYDILKRYEGKITTYIDAVAASAAATIAMAGQTVIISKYALLMIHKPSTITGGTADDLTADATMLDAIQKSIVAIYQAKTGLGEDKIQELVNATTWLTADEALELGFVDVVEDYTAVEPVKNAALVTNYMQSAPNKYKQVINKLLVTPAPAQTENTMTKEEIEALVNPTNSLLKKVANILKLSTNKITTNKGDKYVVGNMVAGSPVFNDADMETEAEDDDDMEVENAAGKKTKMAIKGGKIDNIAVENKTAEEEEDEDEDGDIDADNKAVLNTHAINIKKVDNKVDNKAIKNAIAVKLKEVTNRVNDQNALLVEQQNQIKVLNQAIQRTEEEIREEIKSEFVPTGSQRSSKQAVNSALPDFAKPKEGSQAANALKKSMVGK